MAQEIRQNITALLAKIPLFHGLSPNQCREILQVSHQKSFQPGEKIYGAGTAGDEMLLLLKGRVKILISDGKEVARVEAIDTVGEMEVVGSSLRVADVVADGEVSGLTIRRRALDYLFESNASIAIQLLRNVVDSLARKLGTADQVLAGRFTHNTE